MSEGSSRSITLEQLVALNDEIAALVRSGVPLELGLREMATQADGAMGEISATLAGRMQAGVSLGDALRAEEHRIPPVYRTVVEAGLRAGRLPVALEAMSTFARELIELRRQISAALVYPLIVFALAYGLFLVFTVDLVERFRETYETFRLPLHGMLRWLLWISERVESWWWGPPAVVVGLIVWWWSTGGAHVLSFAGSARPLGWIPGVGRIGRYFQYANFAELLALLVEHNVPLSEGLRLSADATSDVRLRQAVYRFAEAVEQGRETSNLARGTTEIPIFFELLAWFLAGPQLLLLRLFGVRMFDPFPMTFPPFLHWILWQASRGTASAKLLRHAAVFYRRRALNVANWFRLVFPMLAAVFIGGGVTFLYGMALFGPMGALLKDIVLEH